MFGIIPFNLKNILKAFMPISTNGYWYFTAYVILFFLIPFLNKAVEELDAKQCRIAIYAICFFFCCLPMIVGGDLFNTKNGYSAIWLIYLYIVGAYIKKDEKFFEKINAKVATLGIFLLILLTLLVKFILEIKNVNIFGIALDNGILVNYVSPTVFLWSILFVILFKNIKIKEKYKKNILIFSSTTFGVYLIHSNPLVWEFVLKDAFVDLLDLNLICFISMIFGWIVFIYLFCTMIDYIRMIIFKKSNIREILTKKLKV